MSILGKLMGTAQGAARGAAAGGVGRRPVRGGGIPRGGMGRGIGMARRTAAPRRGTYGRTPTPAAGGLGGLIGGLLRRR